MLRKMRDGVEAAAAFVGSAAEQGQPSGSADLLSNQLDQVEERLQSHLKELKTFIGGERNSPLPPAPALCVPRCVGRVASSLPLRPSTAHNRHELHVRRGARDRGAVQGGRGGPVLLAGVRAPFMVVRGAHTVLRPAVGCADRHRAPRPQLSEVHRYLAKDMVKKLASFLAAEVQRPITETVEQARTVRQEIKVRRLSLPFTDLSLPFNAFH